MSYIDEKNEALLVITIPTFNIQDNKWIDDFRRKHDHLFYGVVEPHFTLVFPTFGMKMTDFINDIQKKCTDKKDLNL